MFFHLLSLVSKENLVSLCFNIREVFILKEGFSEVCHQLMRSLQLFNMSEVTIVQGHQVSLFYLMLDFISFIF